MYRDFEAEQQALDTAIGQFESFNDFVFAVNQVLHQEGENTISREAVAAWSRNGIPPERARIIEKATRQVVKREELRPDVFAA
jgi:hypothetical protein